MSQSLRVIRTRLPLVGTLAFATALAACSGGPGGTPAAVTPMPSGVVAVEAAKDGPYSFTPSTVMVPAGSVTFSVKNAGNEEHEFEIFRGDKVVDEVEGLLPGLTKSLTVNLEAGEYTFMCKLNGHDQLGMKGTLIVTGS